MFYWLIWKLEHGIPSWKNYSFISNYIPIDISVKYNFIYNWNLKINDKKIPYIYKKLLLFDTTLQIYTVQIWLNITLLVITYDCKF